MYEEAKNCGVGGEGDSSRAHGIPHGTGNDQLHGSRTVLVYGLQKKSPLDFERGFLCRLHHFEIETEWTEAVVATNHRTHRVLHPPVVEIPLSPGQGLHKLTHGRPGGRTHALRTLAVDGEPLLAFHHVASMLDGILVFRHQIRIDRLADGSDAYLIH